MRRLSAGWGLGVAERFFAAFFMFFCLPMVAFLALIIHATAGKPVFVTGECVKDGRRLRAHRFRTTGPGQLVFRSVGRYIRHYSLDVIPSLWNVVCGEIRLRDISQFRRG
jgi:lipopolysaccharide/colanic/teichoic acid biosynthesis glycosyltransferase